MKRILAVDDNRNNLYFLKTLLEASGYEVLLANEGKQALGVLETEKVDLIISDILMPVMDGFLLCHECQKHEDYKNIPFVFYTATYTDKMDEKLAQKLGSAQFIRKPIEPDELLKIINKVLTENKSLTVEDSEIEIKEKEILKLYSESLINKLEEKNLELIKEIAERKKIEEKLRLSEKSFKAIFEQAAIGVAKIDTQTYEFLNVNQRYRDITGYSNEELKHLTFEEFTHPDDLELDFKNMSRLKTGEIREYSMEQRYFRKNNEIVWVKLTVSSMWNPGEKPTAHIVTIEDITAQKLVERDLRENERFLRTVLENEPECVKILGYYGEVLEMNPAGLAMIEADSIEQVRGKQVLQMVAPKFQDAFAEMTKKVLKGATESLEFEMIGLKGSRRWFETKAAPLRNGSGKVISLLGVTRDVTEQKQFEKALIESEDRYRDLVENSLLMIMTHDFEGNILSANQTTLKSLGYSQEELLKINLKDLLLTDYHKEFDEYITELKEKGIAKGKSRVTKKDGDYRIWEYANTLRTLGVDRPIVRGMATDITERIKAEKALKKYEE